jgi:GTP pyrophosphokinase
VPLSHRLESGDQVEVLTGRQLQVTKDWLSHITTAKARSKVLAIIRRQQRQLQKKGEDMLLDFLREHELATDVSIIDRLCSFHGFSAREQLYINIASHAIVLGDDDVRHITDKGKSHKWRRFIPFLKDKTKNYAQANEGNGAQNPLSNAVDKQTLDRHNPILLNEETISRYLICDKCRPIPGDEVLAFQSEDGYVTIHKRGCSVADRLKAIEGNSIYAAQWDTHKVLYFPAVLHIEGIDRVGVLYQMTAILSQQMNINISNVNINTNGGIFLADIVMEVHDLQDLRDIMRDFKKIKEIEKVVRTS